MILLFLVAISAIASTPTNKTNFVFVGVPDPQYYSMSWPEMLNTQTQWIKDNKDDSDFVICVGDLVQTYTDTSQWNVADTCFAQLYGEMPLLVIPGNHDGATSNWKNYDTYFPYTEFDTFDYYGGHYPDTSNVNNYGFLVKSNDSLLFLGLQWCPNLDVLNWADSIINLYSNLATIVFTHNYLYLDGTRSDTTATYYPTCNTGECAGEQIWDSLISKHSNICLVLNGHYHGHSEKLDFVGDSPVYQHLFDYQDFSAEAQGGWGLLRIYTMNYNMNRIEVLTYSPYLDYYKTNECFNSYFFNTPIISAKQK